MIQYIIILQTNITRTVWQTVRRIINEILGVEGLSVRYPHRLYHLITVSPSMEHTHEEIRVPVWDKTITFVVERHYSSTTWKSQIP